MEQARLLKNGKLPTNSGSVPRSTRLSTSMKQDPNFRANLARFHGEDAPEADEFYKNYRAYYGGATPSVNQAAHMGQVHKE